MNEWPIPWRPGRADATFEEQELVRRLLETLGQAMDQLARREDIDSPIELQAALPPAIVDAFAGRLEIEAELDSACRVHGLSLGRSFSFSFAAEPDERERLVLRATAGGRSRVVLPRTQPAQPESTNDGVQLVVEFDGYTYPIAAGQTIGRRFVEPTGREPHADIELELPSEISRIQLQVISLDHGRAVISNVGKSTVFLGGLPVVGNEHAPAQTWRVGAPLLFGSTEGAMLRLLNDPNTTQPTFKTG